MKNGDFSALRRKKSDQRIKEEYMAGKHGNLTDRQLGIVCEKSGTGRGGVLCAYKPRKHKEEEPEEGFSIPKVYQKKEIK